MLRLNRLTDYAIVVMVHLARSPDVMTAANLAEATCLPQPTVAKILALLARQGLVAAHRGATGGYILARPAHHISMAQIVEAVEGPVALTACVEGASNNCELEGTCVMWGHLDKVNAAIRGALAGLSLREMAGAELDLFAARPGAGKAVPADTERRGAVGL